MSLDMDASDLNFSWVLEGKLAGCAGPVLDRDLRFLIQHSVRALVRLADEREGVFKREDIEKVGLEDCQEAVQDFAAPELDQIERVIAFIHGCLGQGKPVAVSCGAGQGRTGTVLSCYFVSSGVSAQNAIAKVREKGRHPYETEAQRQVIYAYESRLRGQRP